MEEQLKEWVKSIGIEVPIVMGPYTEKIIIAEDFLKKAHELSGLSFEDFQRKINASTDKYNSPMDFFSTCVRSIEYPGAFKIHGWDEVGNRPYIRYNSIKHKI